MINPLSNTYFSDGYLKSLSTCSTKLKEFFPVSFHSTTPIAKIFRASVVIIAPLLLIALAVLGIKRSIKKPGEKKRIKTLPSRSNYAPSLERREQMAKWGEEATRIHLLLKKILSKLKKDFPFGVDDWASLCALTMPHLSAISKEAKEIEISCYTELEKKSKHWLHQGKLAIGSGLGLCFAKYRDHFKKQPDVLEKLDAAYKKVSKETYQEVFDLILDAVK